LIALFLNKIKNNEKLTIVSPGTQKRNFTHIDDIISGLILIGENGYGDDFGIGCEKSYTVLEVAKMFGGDIEMLPERRGNRMVADVITEKTMKLGWSPKKTLNNYIQECLN